MVKIKINDPALSATVCSLMALCSIPTGGGDILICDSPEHVEGCRGVVVIYPDDGYLQSHEHTILLGAYGERYMPVVRPFSFDRFCETVRQLLVEKNSQPQAPTQSLSITPGGTVTYNGMSAGLSERELALFVYLLEHRGQTLSRDELKSAVWKNETGQGTNIVDVYISYLRKKLTPIFGKGVILSERGGGYSLNLPKE
ncbi:MAG: winged helix-turn-helix transcriptional regulator [Ruminococcaceae bacterium]|nr:winged helix-turn-helix transcriptional regulator [Oscillospiraceae bacterium]